MRNFIIFFIGKEGTSPLIRLLNNFDRVSVLHQEGGGLEPFDQHECGPISIRNLRKCLDMVLSGDPIDLNRLNRIYTKTSVKPFAETERNCAVGFKMRFKPPANRLAETLDFKSWNKWASQAFTKHRNRSFRKMMLEVLKRNKPVVFFAFRHDLLRWSLSKYHGDGNCRPGHIQFDLASGKISRGEIGKIHVDCDRLEEIIEKSEKMIARKIRLMEVFRSNGIDAFPLIYEDFHEDKYKYFSRFFEIIDIEVSKQEIKAALEKGAYYKKVHSDEISEFVINHQEVMDRFGGRETLVKTC